MADIIATVLLIFFIITTYWFIKRLQQIFFNRQQANEIFDYLDSIIDLQKYLMDESVIAIENHNLKRAEVLHNVIVENFKKYDIIRPLLTDYLNNDFRNTIPWRVKFRLPLFFTVDNNSNTIPATI